ncbi:diguanylate cyclase, partial [Pelomonas sp. KK5]|uniref:GGDEF domain-containing protein n=1 Tax=Pelomonas sp. KK5 TaxID=1855730 RepID=UPI00097C2B5D
DDRSPATRDATPAQQRRFLLLALLVIGGTVLLAPFATQRLPKVPAFFPAYQSAVILCHLATAYLMQGLYEATRQRSLLYLSAGNYYAAGVLVLQLLALPGAVVDGGVLLGGPQTMSWLWFFWHAAPSLSLLLFACAELGWPLARAGRPRRAARLASALTLAALAATGLFVGVFHASLPVLVVNDDYSGIIDSGMTPALELLLLLAMAVLFRLGRLRKVLHLWLALSLVALFCDNAITMLGGTRLSLGWYAGRLGALLSAMVLPLVYLEEIKRGYVRAARQVGRLVEANAELSVEVDRSRHDELTGIPGRALFLERSAALLQHCLQARSGFACLFIDLDGFKAVNDRFGHERGDQVLQAVAAILQAELRGTDTAGRIGGDEFAACLASPDPLHQQTAIAVANRIIQRIGGLGMGLGASIGISTSRHDIEQALREADEAMYDAKRTGKGRSMLYRPRPKLAVSG